MRDINDSVAREAYLEREAQGDFDDHRESDDEPIEWQDPDYNYNEKAADDYCDRYNDAQLGDNCE
jgi:hypothetical protein